MRLRIAPSVLSARFERLGDEVKAVEAGGADQIHVDVMDGHFVPNLSMGPIVVEALRRVTRLPLDVHLMITDPERYLEPFVAAGANHVTFHVEANGDPARLAAWLHDHGVGAGIALNPETPVERILGLLDHFDMALVMTVHPGFGGQTFLAENLLKVEVLRDRQGVRGRTRPLQIEVDGGIDHRTAAEARAAGADVFVAGNSIFRSADIGGAVRALRVAVEGRRAC